MHKFLRRLLPAGPATSRKSSARPAPLARPAFRPGVVALEDRLTPTLSFNPQVAFAVGTGPAEVAVGDFNGDGRGDFVTANSGNNTVTVRLSTTALGAAPTFAAPQTFAVGNGPFALAVGDLNGDGRPDIAAANTVGGNVSVLLNTTAAGAAAASFAAKQDFVVGATPAFIALADFNGDGKTDVATTSSDTLTVRINTTPAGGATASFATQLQFVIGAGESAIAVGDLNGDGWVDVATASQDDNQVSVLLNEGYAAPPLSPAFATRQTFAVGTAPQSVTVADFNGDGRLDIATANFSTTNVSVLRNTTPAGGTTPTFATGQSVAVGAGPVGITSGDLNGDGKADLIVANGSGNSVSVLANRTANGANTYNFATPLTFATAAGPNAMRVTDVNGDGRLDLLTANITANSVSVLLNNAQFAAALPITVPVGVGPVEVAVADFNLDGRPDTAAANYFGGSVGVMLNTSSGTGNIGFTPQTAFPFGPSPNAVVAADFNGDGRPDLATANAIDGGGGNNVSVRVNQTAIGAMTAAFGAEQPFAVGTDPKDLFVGDFNLDGRPDLIVANRGSDNLTVLLNSTLLGAATVTFTPGGTFAAGDVSAVVVADFNGDGRPDVASTNVSGNSTQVRLGTTPAGSNTISFAAPTVIANGASPYALAVGDLNGDGRPDLAIANLDAGTVGVRLNTTAAGAATPSFANGVGFAVAAGPGSVTLADLDGDGRLDVMTANGASDVVTVRLNTMAAGAAAPSLGAPQQFDVGDNPDSVRAGDFDSDGRPDLVTANIGSNDLSILRNVSFGGAVSGGTLTGQFGTTGVWRYNRITGGWAQLTGANAAVMAVSANGNMIASFVGNALWYYRPTGGWAMINGNAATAVAIDGMGNAYVSFAGFGTFVYRPATGGFTQISTAVANLLSASSDGTLYANLPGQGVFSYRPATGMVLLNGFNATSLTAAENGSVVAAFAGFGMAQYIAYARGWRLLSPSAATAVAVDPTGQVYASFAGFGVGRWSPATRTWTSIAPNAAPTSLAADWYGSVFLSPAGFGVAEYNSTVGWNQRRTSDALILAIGR